MTNESNQTNQSGITNVPVFYSSMNRTSSFSSMPTYSMVPPYNKYNALSNYQLANHQLVINQQMPQVPYQYSQPGSTFAYQPNTYGYRTSSFIYTPDPYQANSLTNSPRSSFTSNNSFVESEQKVLDDGFLSLLQTESTKGTTNVQLRQNVHQNHVEYRKNREARISDPLSNIKNNNLIDLDTWVDHNPALSVIELFDPLAQIKPEPKVEIKSIEPVDVVAVPRPVRVNSRASAPEFRSESKPQELSQSRQIKSESVGEDVLTKEKGSSRRGALKRRQRPITNNEQRRSIMSLNIEELQSRSQFETFESRVQRLSEQIFDDKKQLSNLIVFSPLLDCSVLRDQSIRLYIKYNNVKQVISPSANAKVETVLYNVLSLFNIDDMDTDKYLLKIHGLEEYLPIYASLAELKYLHECLTENREPVLVLTEIRHIDVALNEDSKPNVFKLNIGPDIISVPSRTKLESLIKNVVQNKQLIDEAINDGGDQLDSVLNWSMNLREKLRLLISLLNSIHFAGLHSLIEKLEFSEKNLRSLQNGNQLRDRQPLMLQENGNTSDATDSSLQLLYSTLQDTCNQVIVTVANFVNCAAESFAWPFKVKINYKLDTSNESSSISQTIELLESEDKYFLCFNGISRIYSLLNEKASR